MLEILKTGRLPAGIWIPGWEQGLSPLTEAPFPRAYPVPPRSDKKGPEQRTDTMRALAEEAILLWELGRREEALAKCEEIGRYKAEGPVQRDLAAGALYSKAALLYILNRKDDALRVCDEIIRRFFGRAKTPALRVVVAKSLYKKEILLYELDRRDEVLPVCEQFLRLFGTANEPAAREGMRITLLCKTDRLWELGRKYEALGTCVEFLRLFDTANAPRENIETILSAKKRLLRELGLSYNPADTGQPRITGEKDEGHVQGPLHDYFESRGVPESLQPKLAAKIDDLVKAEITGRDAAPVAEPATQEAKTEAQAFAAARASGAKAKPRTLWEKRKGAEAKLSPPEFVAKHYAAEMAAGTLHRGVIAQEDKPLAVKLASWLRSHPMPDGIDIPTKPEWNTRELAKLDGAAERDVLRLYEVAKKRKGRLATLAA